MDGDPRFHKQKFMTNNQREQVQLWTEKEYRNLLRAHRGGVKVPMVLKQKENVLFMRFLGESGWPSPQLREVEIKKGSEKWTVLYCQTIAAIRRLVCHWIGGSCICITLTLKLFSFTQVISLFEASAC